MHKNSSITFFNLVILCFMGTTMFSSCHKNHLTVYDTQVNFLKVYTDTSADTPIGVVAGKESILCHYKTTTQINRFILTDHEGHTKRTFDLGGYGFDITTIIYEQDHTYSIFRNDSIFRVNEQGNFISRIPVFLIPGIISPYGFKYLLMKNNHYFSYGYTYLSPGYNVVAEFTHEGNLIYSKLLSIPGAGSHGTVCLTDDGGVLICTEEPGPVFTTHAFSICKLNSVGDPEWMKTYDRPVCGLGNRAISPSGDGHFVCYTTQMYPMRTVLYKLNIKGELLDSSIINFSSQNLLVGSVASYLGILNGNIVRRNGDLFVLLYDQIREQRISQTNILVSSNTYIAQVGSDMKLKDLRSIQLQHEHSDNFNSVSELPDGRIAVFGMVQSGTTYKPSLFLVQ